MHVSLRPGHRCASTVFTRTAAQHQRARQQPRAMDVEQELLQLSQNLLDSIADRDWDKYSELCAVDLTAFEPEAGVCRCGLGVSVGWSAGFLATGCGCAASKRPGCLRDSQSLFCCCCCCCWCAAAGHLVQGLPFHQFYFDLLKSRGTAYTRPTNTISQPHVGAESALLTASSWGRLMGVGCEQGVGAGGSSGQQQRVLARHTPMSAAWPVGHGGSRLALRLNADALLQAIACKFRCCCCYCCCCC